MLAALPVATRHVCSACGYAGGSERDLLRHFRAAHYTPLGARSIIRVQCRRCRRNFDSEYSCLQHEVQAHRDRAPRRRLRDAEALEMRRQLPYGPVNPALVPGWAQRYGVSEDYVWAVALGLAHLHQDALPEDSLLNAELDRRYRMSGRKRSVRRRTVQVKKCELAASVGDAPLACGYCGVAITIGEATKDHKVPVNMGGGNELENLHLVCLPCNRLKSDRTDAEFRLILELGRVYGERAEGVVLRAARRLAMLDQGGK